MQVGHETCKRAINQCSSHHHYVREASVAKIQNRPDEELKFCKITTDRCRVVRVNTNLLQEAKAGQHIPGDG